LEALARSARRDEADRARAILLSVNGWTSGQIARAFGVTPDSVRRWRTWFLADGIDGLRAAPHAGAAPVKSDAALALAGELVGAGGGPGKLDVAAIAGRVDRPHRTDDLQITAQQGAEKRGFRWRRPRHCLNGRQNVQAVDYAGLRLRLLRQQAEAGDIVLLFGDESEALTHPYLAHAWAPRGADLRVPAPGQARKQALLGALDHSRRELIVHVSASKRSTDFIALLEVLDRRYGPKPGRTIAPVVLVLDNGPIHTSKLTRAALAQRPWLTIEWLPKYAPELNDIERSWRDLKRHFLAHQTFQSVEHLDAALHNAIAKLNQERKTHMCHDQRIAA
jgi:transposase